MSHIKTPGVWVVEAGDVVATPGRAAEPTRDQPTGRGISVDCSALRSNFNINYNAVGGRDYPPGLHEFALLPGRYTLCCPSSAAGFGFEVTLAGLLDYDAGLDGFVRGRGTRRLDVLGSPIEVDATALRSNFNINHNGVGNRDFPPEVTDFALLPGRYTFCSPSSAVGFAFEVTERGMLDFAASLDGVVEGRGTRRLTVRGRPVTVDATALRSNFNINYNGVGNRDFPPEVTDFALLPGRYTFCSPSSAVGFAFEVTEQGMLDFAASLDGVVEGRGTPRLTVRGRPVTVDATALRSNFNINYNGVGNRDFPPEVTDFALLPGRYTFCSPSSAVGFAFVVDAAGLIELDASLDGHVLGRGTRTLTVLGRPIRVDATALGSRFNINYNGVGNRDFPPEPTDFALLPGSYTLCCPSSAVPLAFTVEPTGTIDYDAGLDRFVEGRGTRTLTLRGAAITVDVTALGSCFNLNYNGVGMRDFLPEPTHFALLPGRYTLCCPSSAVGFAFEVTPAGLLDYDASLDGFVRGRATDRLTVLGLAVTIDVTALGAAFNVNYNAVGNRSFPAQVTALALLPGSYTFCCPPSTNPILFHVGPDGRVDYDRRLDPFLSGRGTATLTARGSSG